MMNRYLFILFYFLLGLNCLISNDIDKSRENAITNAIKVVSPAVVGINVTQIKQHISHPFFDPFFDPFIDPFFEDFFKPRARNYKVKNLGSGIIISNDGYIVTNSHVIEQADEIVVSITGGDTFLGTIIGFDDLTDIALIKIDGNNFPYVEFGNSNNLIIGEWVIALGNPLGLFDVSNNPTATVGILSGKSMDFGQKESGRVYQNMLQTDASINPGNSGGPLVNSLGEVIGLNTFIMTNSNYTQGSIGIGFAIPINQVVEISDLLKINGKIDRTFSTGIHVQPLDKTMRKYFNINNNQGVIIKDIDFGSSGERAGLRVGDVILTVNNIKIENIDNIMKIIEEGLYQSNDFITVEILRDGNEVFYQLQLEGTTK